MRTIVVKHLIKAAEKDSSIYLLTGDLGFGALDPFREKFPNRFINAGIAEQNMIGVAAGLAMTGKKVFVYSIIPFVTMRCFEQVRNDLCYQNLPVTFFCNGGGLSYGSAAATHQAIEDIAIMRSLPGMTVIAPGNKFEIEQLMPAIMNHTDPLYLRLSSYDELVPYPTNAEIKIEKITEIIPHDQHLIIATGNSLDLGYKVCKHLEQQGIIVGLASSPTIKPFDKEYFLKKQSTLKTIFTIEEHSVIGGLGETIAKILCEDFDNKVTFKAFGINDFYFHEAGSRKDLLTKAGLTVENLSDAITRKIMQSHINTAEIQGALLQG